MKNISSETLLKYFFSRQSVYTDERSLTLYWTWKTVAFKSKEALKLLQSDHDAVMPRDEILPERDSGFRLLCEDAFNEFSPTKRYFPKDDALEVAASFFANPAVQRRKDFLIHDPNSFLNISMEYYALSLVWKNFFTIQKKTQLNEQDFLNALLNLQELVDGYRSELMGAWRHKKQFAASRTGKATQGKQASMDARRKAVVDVYHASGIGQRKMTMHRMAVKLIEEMENKYPNLKKCSLNTIKTILIKEGIVTRT